MWTAKSKGKTYTNNSLEDLAREMAKETNSCEYLELVFQDKPNLPMGLSSINKFIDQLAKINPISSWDFMTETGDVLIDEIESKTLKQALKKAEDYVREELWTAKHEKRELPDFTNIAYVYEKINGNVGAYISGAEHRGNNIADFVEKVHNKIRPEIEEEELFDERADIMLTYKCMCL